MADVADSNIDPWGRSLSETLRRWWWIPTTLALLGVLVGVAAGLNSPKSATAIVSVQITSENPDALRQATQSAMTEVSTQEVFSNAATARNNNPTALRSRSEISIVPDSTMLAIKVTADTADAAAADANALAKAGVDQSASRMQNQLKALTQNTETLISGQGLRDTQAERTRITQLGGALAQSQQNLLTQSRQLTLLQSASAAVAT